MKRKKRIWFNRWFSTLYHYIQSIKDNPDGEEFEIFGTYPTEKSVYLEMCDVTEIEPQVTGEEYIEFCLDFIKRHEIDLFIPRHQMSLISKHIERFQALGVKVLVSTDASLMELIEDKARFYEHIRPHGIVNIPEYYVVNTPKEFLSAYEKIVNNGSRVCFKPVKGEGGVGFTVIRNEPKTIETLLGHGKRNLSIDDIMKILTKTERFDDVMVMEYLDGFEYSVDCLAHEGVLLAAVPRKKTGERVQELEDNKELIESVKKMTEIYQLPYVFNVQFKMKDGIPKLLEINPRMSGGLHQVQMSGINYPYLAVKLLLEGKKIDVPEPKLGISVSYVESPVLLTKLTKKENL